MHNPLDPCEVDGPSAGWYAELRETEGRPWPRPVVFTRTSHLVGIALGMARGPRPWTCPKCGGPAICPTLASTLPFRKCGYAEDDRGRWVHQ